jgi:hypothetical protein
MAIIGQYQGALDVPIFVAPYSVTTPAYIAPTNQGNLNPYSDMPVMGERYGHIANVSGMAGFDVPNSGWAAGLTYSKSNVFTINGGYNANTAFYTSSTPVASLLKNRMTFGMAWVGDLFKCYAQIYGVPFYKDTNSATPVANTGLARNGVMTFNGSPGSQIKHGGSYTVMPCALSGIFQFSNPIIGFLMPLGNNTQLAIIAPDVQNSQNPVDFVTGFPLQSGISVLDAEIMWNLMQFGGTLPRNYLWCIPSTGVNKITVARWHSALAGNNSGVQVESTDLFSFDNPALNAVLAKYNPVATCFPCGLRGWLFMDIDNQVDYFVDVTGQRYWRLNYLPQGNAKPVPSGSEAAYKFVDFNGVFWYTGLATQTGQTVTPQYSFGYSIPFNRVTLPPIPPMSLPCYADCLGQGVNITRRL